MGGTTRQQRHFWPRSMIAYGMLLWAVSLIPMAIAICFGNPESWNHIVYFPERIYLPIIGSALLVLGIVRKLNIRRS